MAKRRRRYSKSTRKVSDQPSHQASREILHTCFPSFESRQTSSQNSLTNGFAFLSGGDSGISTTARSPNNFTNIYVEPIHHDLPQIDRPLTNDAVHPAFCQRFSIENRDKHRKNIFLSARKTSLKEILTLPKQISENKERVKTTASLRQGSLGVYVTRGRKNGSTRKMSSRLMNIFELSHYPPGGPDCQPGCGYTGLPCYTCSTKQQSYQKGKSQDYAISTLQRGQAETRPFQNLCNQQRPKSLRKKFICACCILFLIIITLALSVYLIALFTFHSKGLL